MTIHHLNRDCIIPGPGRAVIFARPMKPSGEPISLSHGIHVSLQRSLEQAHKDFLSDYLNNQAGPAYVARKAAYERMAIASAWIRRASA